ncbi:MAG: hypothetical protein WA667_04425 [Candidatus Nitrosopolaris sp.]
MILDLAGAGVTVEDEKPFNQVLGKEDLLELFRKMLKLTRIL